MIENAFEINRRLVAVISLLGLNGINGINIFAVQWNQHDIARTVKNEGRSSRRRASTAQQAHYEEGEGELYEHEIADQL